MASLRASATRARLGPLVSASALPQFCKALEFREFRGQYIQFGEFRGQYIQFGGVPGTVYPIDAWQTP